MVSTVEEVDPRDPEIVHAAEMANAAKFVSELPNGFLTEVGVSGGTCPPPPPPTRCSVYPVLW